MNKRNTRGFLSVPLLILIGIVLTGSAGVGAFAYFKHVPASEPKEAALPEFEARVASSTAGGNPKVEAKEATAPQTATTGSASVSQENTAESIRAAERAELKRQAQLQKSGSLPGVWSEQEEDGAEQRPYDSGACIVQKKEFLPVVEAKYESWYQDWQSARATLDSCYDTNTVPYCDGKMTELNVEWQAKWSATVKTYYQKLDKCSPEDRRFGDVSTTLSSY